MSDDFEMRPNIDASIEGGLDMFEMEVRRLWPDANEAKRAIATADKVAEMIQNDIAELSGTREGSSWQAVRDALTAQDIKDTFDFALQSRLAWHLKPSFVIAGRRCWELASLLQQTNPPAQSRRFLRRVTRCYLLAMDPECMVMCRGALESALNSRFATENVPHPRNPQGQATLKARLVYAERAIWLGGVTANDLYSEVWLRGSKAAHDDPDVVGDPLKAITLTIRALTGLAPSASTLEDEGAV